MVLNLSTEIWPIPAVLKFFRNTPLNLDLIKYFSHSNHPEPVSKTIVNGCGILDNYDKVRPFFVIGILVIFGGGSWHHLWSCLSYVSGCNDSYTLIRNKIFDLLGCQVEFKFCCLQDDCCCLLDNVCQINSIDIYFFSHPTNFCFWIPFEFQVSTSK